MLDALYTNTFMPFYELTVSCQSLFPPRSPPYYTGVATWDTSSLIATYNSQDDTQVVQIF